MEWLQPVSRLTDFTTFHNTAAGRAGAAPTHDQDTRPLMNLTLKWSSKYSKNISCYSYKCISLLVLLFCTNIFFFLMYFCLETPPLPSPPPALPVHAGVCPMVVEGSLRADAALLTLLPTVLRDGEGGAPPLAGRHTGAVLHGGRTGDGCSERRRQRKDWGSHFHTDSRFWCDYFCAGLQHSIIWMHCSSVTTLSQPVVDTIFNHSFGVSFVSTWWIYVQYSLF